MKILGTLGIDWKIFLIQTVNFLILFWILKKLFFKRFIAALKKEKLRQKMIKDGKIDLEREKREMEKREDEIIRKTREKTRQVIEEEKKVSDEEKERIMKRTEKEVKTILREARERAGIEVKKLREGEEGKVLEVSREILGQVLSTSFSREMHHNYIKETIKELKRVDFSKFKGRDIVQVTVISAVPLGAKEQKEISGILFGKLRNSAFQQKIDSGIIAGIKIFIGGFLLDGSLESKIKKAL